MDVGMGEQAWRLADEDGAPFALIGSDTHASNLDEDISINTRRFPAAVTPGADPALVAAPLTC